PAGLNETADARTEYALESVGPDGMKQPVEMLLFLRPDCLFGGPFLHPLHGEKSRFHAVDDVVDRVSRVVRPIHDLAFDAFEQVEAFAAMQHLGYGGPAKNIIPAGLLRVIQKMVLRRP